MDEIKKEKEKRKQEERKNKKNEIYTSKYIDIYFEVLQYKSFRRPSDLRLKFGIIIFVCDIFAGDNYLLGCVSECEVRG